MQKEIEKQEQDLTLTSVVFELSNCGRRLKNGSDLTLTSVVFEFTETKNVLA